MAVHDGTAGELDEAVRLGVDAGFDPFALPESCPYGPADADRRRLWLDAFSKGRIAFGLLTRTAFSRAEPRATQDPNSPSPT